MGRLPNELIPITYPKQRGRKSATTDWAHYVGSSSCLITIVVITLCNRRVQSRVLLFQPLPSSKLPTACLWDNNFGLWFWTELGRRISLASGNKRETSFLFQRLSVCIQRFNSVAFEYLGANNNTDNNIPLSKIAFISDGPYIYRDLRCSFNHHFIDCNEVIGSCIDTRVICSLWKVWWE